MRVNAVITHLTPIIGTALDQYKKGEWMTLVKAQEKEKVKEAKEAKEAAEKASAEAKASRRWFG